ncbi:uncharacterized protein CTRU02_208225 [Colletotrichum truncatum]|uniref:Uncharacterized protein n=1 Tax=Colletotrichum truncatum TaxID=5467 RepID=A0ACC3YVN2_COLTU
MAPLSPTALLHKVVARDGTGASSSCSSVQGTCIEVVCAWPLSGQYGFGQRILYYILVVVCVVARKAKWMRAVSLAAALLVPAVAAIHGIILASLHVDGELQETQLEAKKLKPSATGATDMDIYGALQFCSIGILAAPVTVKLSSTFFFDPGRNIIFLWTGLILSGLLSLAVEFYRSNTTACTHDDAGNPIPTSSGSFPYGGDAMCNLTCSQDDGPLSYLRLGAASEIYVVPKPTKLPFGMAMFLAAAECVPAILSLVTMWNKILEINWKARRGGGSQEKEQPNKLIPGANGATFGGMRDVNQAIRSLLSAIEVPVFAGAWLAVLIIGEINFWSPQVNYHTEPIGSIGQWGTILGTGMAGLGSLYVYLADDKKEHPEDLDCRCSCAHCHDSRKESAGMTNEGTTSPRTSTAHHEFVDHQTSSGEGTSTEPSKGEWISRRKMANWLGKVGNYVGNPAKDPFGAGDFQLGQYPRTPGEDLLNSRMAEHEETFSVMGVDASSTRGSPDYGSGSDGGSVPPTPNSPESPIAPSPPNPRARTARRHASVPSRQSSFEQLRQAAVSSDDPRGRPQGRRATLEVPPSARHR